MKIAADIQLNNTEALYSYLAYHDPNQRLNKELVTFFEQKREKIWQFRMRVEAAIKKMGDDISPEELNTLTLEMFIGGSSVWQYINALFQNGAVMPGTDTDAYMLSAELLEILKRKKLVFKFKMMLAAEFGISVEKIKGDENTDFLCVTGDVDDYNVVINYEFLCNFHVLMDECGNILYDPNNPAHEHDFKRFILNDEIICYGLDALMAPAQKHEETLLINQIAQDKARKNKSIKKTAPNPQTAPTAEAQAFRKLAFVIKSLYKPLEQGKHLSKETAQVFYDFFKNSHFNLRDRLVTHICKHYKETFDGRASAMQHMLNIEKMANDIIEPLKKQEQELNAQAIEEAKNASEAEIKNLKTIINIERTEFNNQRKLMLEKSSVMSNALSALEIKLQSEGVKAGKASAEADLAKAEVESLRKMVVDLNERLTLENEKNKKEKETLEKEILTLKSVENNQDANNANKIEIKNLKGELFNVSQKALTLTLEKEALLVSVRDSSDRNEILVRNNELLKNNNNELSQKNHEIEGERNTLAAENKLLKDKSKALEKQLESEKIMLESLRPTQITNEPEKEIVQQVDEMINTKKKKKKKSKKTSKQPNEVHEDIAETLLSVLADKSETDLNKTDPDTDLAEKAGSHFSEEFYSDQESGINAMTLMIENLEELKEKNLDEITYNEAFYFIFKAGLKLSHQKNDKFSVNFLETISDLSALTVFLNSKYIKNRIDEEYIQKLIFISDSITDHFFDENENRSSKLDDELKKIDNLVAFFSKNKQLIFQSCDLIASNKKLLDCNNMYGSMKIYANEYNELLKKCYPDGKMINYQVHAALMHFISTVSAENENVTYEHLGQMQKLCKAVGEATVVPASYSNVIYNKNDDHAKDEFYYSYVYIAKKMLNVLGGISNGSQELNDLAAKSGKKSFDLIPYDAKDQAISSLSNVIKLLDGLMGSNLEKLSIDDLFLRVSRLDWDNYYASKDLDFNGYFTQFHKDLSSLIAFFDSSYVKAYADSQRIEKLKKVSSSVSSVLYAENGRYSLALKNAITNVNNILEFYFNSEEFLVLGCNIIASGKDILKQSGAKSGIEQYLHAHDLLIKQCYPDNNRVLYQTEAAMSYFISATSKTNKHVTIANIAVLQILMQEYAKNKAGTQQPVYIAKPTYAKLPAQPIEAFFKVWYKYALDLDVNKDKGEMKTLKNLFNKMKVAFPDKDIQQLVNDHFAAIQYLQEKHTSHKKIKYNSPLYTQLTPLLDSVFIKKFSEKPWCEKTRENDTRLPGIRLKIEEAVNDLQEPTNYFGFSPEIRADDWKLKCVLADIVENYIRQPAIDDQIRQCARIISDELLEIPTYKLDGLLGANNNNLDDDVPESDLPPSFKNNY